MEIKWTPSARQSLRQIRSIHFTQEETKRYKVELVRKIEQQVAVILEAMPASEPSWQGTYTPADRLNLRAGAIPLSLFKLSNWLVHVI